MDDFDKMPESVREIADVIGREKALMLIGAQPRAGSRPWRVCIYIPKRLPPDHDLVRLLGWKDAVKLHRAFTGMILQPSNVRWWARNLRDRRIVELSELGASAVEIAAEFRLSVSRVREILERQEVPRLAAE